MCSLSNNERYIIQKWCQALVFKTLQQKGKVVVKNEVMPEMCEPQAASSSLCCPRSIWDQLCTGTTQAGFSDRSRKQHLLPFRVLFLNQTFFTWSPAGLCFHVLQCLQNMIWYQLHDRWLGKGVDSSSQGGVQEGTRGKPLFSSLEVTSWWVTEGWKWIKQAYFY